MLWTKTIRHVISLQSNVLLTYNQTTSAYYLTTTVLNTFKHQKHIHATPISYRDAKNWSCLAYNTMSIGK